MKGKTDTLVLDFVNKPDAVQDSFQPYYQGTLLSEETDPNKLYSIETEIKKYHLFLDETVLELVDKFYDDRVPDEELQPILDYVVEDWRKLNEDEREDFRHQIQSFIRLYGYISQIITFRDMNLEKLYIFLRFLNKKLPKRERDKLVDIFSYVDLEYFRIEKKFTTNIELDNGDGEVPPISTEPGDPSIEEPIDLLSHIIQVLNENYGSDLSDDDKVNLEKIQKKLVEDEELRKVYVGDNTESNRKYEFNKKFDKILLGLVDENLKFYKKISEPKRNLYVKEEFYKHYAKPV